MVKINDEDEIFRYIRGKTGLRSFGREHKPKPWDKKESYSFLDRLLNFVAEYTSKEKNKLKVFDFEFNKESLLANPAGYFITPRESKFRPLFEVEDE